MRRDRAGIGAVQPPNGAQQGKGDERDQEA
jgi:hypothetical protein